MKNIIFVAVVCLLSACGEELPFVPDAQQRPAPEVPFDASVVGNWTGTVVTEIEDRPTDSREITVRFRGDQNSISISGLCPTGEGTVTLTKGGDDLTWSRYVCSDPLYPLSSAQLVFSIGSYALDSGKLLISMKGFWEEPASANRLATISFSSQIKTSVAPSSPFAGDWRGTLNGKTPSGKRVVIPAVIPVVSAGSAFVAKNVCPGSPSEMTSYEVREKYVYFRGGPKGCVIQTDCGESRFDAVGASLQVVGEGVSQVFLALRGTFCGEATSAEVTFSALMSRQDY